MSAATGHGAAPAADVNVTLGDMWVKADKPSVKAGEVSFAVRNDGATVHGMAIAQAPVDALGGISARTRCSAWARSWRLASGVVSADLKPGAYELVCFLPGHYAAGQKLAFDVTG